MKIVHKVVKFDDEGNYTAVECGAINFEFAVEFKENLAIVPTLTPCTNCFK